MADGLVSCGVHGLEDKRSRCSDSPLRAPSLLVAQHYRTHRVSSPSIPLPDSLHSKTGSDAVVKMLAHHIGVLAGES